MPTPDPNAAARQYLRESTSIGRGGTGGLAAAMAMFGLVVAGLVWAARFHGAALLTARIAAFVVGIGVPLGIYVLATTIVRRRVGRD